MPDPPLPADGGSVSDAGAATDAGPDDGGATGPSDAGQPEGDAGVASCTVAPVSLVHDGPLPGPNIVRFIDTTRYPGAVCNDGTPAAYFIRPGTGDAARRWIIYLEGGGSCSRPEGCARRPLSLSSTAGINRTDGQTIALGQGGIASSDPAVNPDFYDATTVQLNYCSSDLWSGDVGATPGAPETDLRHWHFRGKRIVRAVIAELLRREGLATAREVFFMGSSAGGAGTLANIDETRAALPAGVRFVGLIDGIYGIEYAPFDPATGLESTNEPPTTGPTSIAERFDAWRPEGDASCTARYGAMDPTCNVVPRLLETNEIETPLLVIDSQMDSNQLKDLGVTQMTPATTAFAQRYAAAKRARLPSLSQRYGLYSFSSTEHVLINKSAFWTGTTVAGTALRATVGQWYQNPCAPPVRIVDQR
ncbi:MAG: pectin acetylesterase-family hydrolase [Myxococcaceae bacterium]|nr:pectin acetylesterase-family hydrolase [Myxococcaceae bacterium]